MATIALNMIVKDEYDQVAGLIFDASSYFNQINLTVSDGPTATRLEEFVKDKGIDTSVEINIEHRAWNDKFDDARNFNLAQCTTDFWFWMDADDYFDFSTIQDLLEFAEANELDQILLPYHYAHDDQGNVVAIHWRERLMRRSHPFTWKGWVHETPVTDIAFKAQRASVPVIHTPPPDHARNSIERNHKILLKATKESDDPRYMMYLGSSFHALGDYSAALRVLNEFTKVSGSHEDIYRVLNVMAECAHWQGGDEAAIRYSLDAAALIPEYPTAYWLLAQWEASRNAWAEALEWVRVGESKPDPTGFGVYDPQSRDRGRLIAVECEVHLGNYNNALTWLRKVNPKNESRKDLEEYVVNEADAETFIKLLPKFVKYFSSESVLYNSLANDLKYDARLRGLREQVEDPKTWDKNSVVILCGEGYEEWGPHTLDKGMGGSEEAIVYLSRELSKLGYSVVVYGAVNEKIIDGPEGTNVPVYLPWKQFNRMDKFNVFVAWRAPDFTEHVTAKVKIVDLHDIVPKERIKDYGDVLYFVKSQYHRDLYPHIEDKKFRIIGNGIAREQFDDAGDTESEA